LQNDPTGSSREFHTRKSASFFDPYNEELEFAALKFEDEVRMRASLVVDAKLLQLNDLKDMAAKGKLTFADKERLNQVESLLKRLNDIKIVDAPVLLKLYNLYRYQLE